MLGPTALGLATLAVSATVMLAAANLRISPRPPLVRGLAVALAAAVLSALPVVAWAVLEGIEGGPRADLVTAAFASGLVQLWFALHMRPIAPRSATSANAPPTTGLAVFPPGFLEHLNELARELGSPLPKRVILVRTLHLLTQAWAFGLVEPGLAISDGIFERLEPGERDAILGHELAHLATRSIWLHALLAVPAGLAAVATSTCAGRGVAIAFGFAFFVGLGRVVQRRVEIACDLRGARAVGHVAMARALAKIHAAVDLAEVGLAAYVVFATTTHPPRALRLAALRRAAPESERGAIAAPVAVVLGHRLAAWLAFVAWVAALASGLKLARVADGSFSLPLLWGAAGAPFLVLGLAQQRKLEIVQKRVAQRQHGQLLVVVASVLVTGSAMGLLFMNLDYTFANRAAELSKPLVGSLVMGVFLATIVVRRALLQTRARKAVLVALQLRDFGGAVAAGERFSDVAARDPGLRHDIALAVALLGARGEAIERLEQLSTEPGAPPLTLLTLALVYAEEDRPESSLDAATRGMARLPRDAGPLFHAARAHRTLGHTREAVDFLERARRLAPRDAYLSALEALLALDRGEPDEARRQIATALELAPGQPFVLTARAEVALALESLEAASAAVDAARRAAEASPIAFVACWVDRLGARLGASSERGATASSNNLE